MDNTYSVQQLRDMMKLIPNNFPIRMDDLKEIFSQKEK